MPIQTRVLLIEDNVLDAKFVQSALLNDIGQGYELKWITSLAGALKFVVKREGDYFSSLLSAGDFSRKLTRTKQLLSVCAKVPIA